MPYYLYVTSIEPAHIAVGISSRKDGAARVQRHLAKGKANLGSLGRTLHYLLQTNDHREAQAVLDDVRRKLESKGAYRVGLTTPELDMVYNVRDRISANFVIQRVLKAEASYRRQTK